MTRLDLPFVVPIKTGGIESHWNVKHDETGFNSDDREIGRSHFERVAKLAEHDEFQALMAMYLPTNSGQKSNWNCDGWGIEHGFSEAIAAAAIVGLRCIREGLAKPYNVDEARRMAA